MHHADLKSYRLLLATLIALLIIALAKFVPTPFASAAPTRETAAAATQLNSLAAMPETIFTVINTNDSGAGSLRQAILDSNAAGGSNTINFSGISYPATITLLSALPSMTTTVTINGPGASNLAVSGNNAFRVFDTFSAITLTISGLTVRDGVVSNNDGGGIRSNSASAKVTLNNVNVINNMATGSPGRGGGLFLAGGVVTVTNGLFMNNVASGAVGGGGITLFAGSLTISNTTFIGNQANGQNGGGGISSPNTGTMIVNASTFFSNTAAAGGAVTLAANNFFTNTTFVGNSAPSFGAAILAVGSNNQFVNSTIYGNSGDHAVYNSAGSITLKNSIVASPKTGDNCLGIANGGNNIDSGTSCGWGGVSGSLGSTDPKLAPLGNYGGPTQTMGLLVGSPAINKATANCPSTDQRGVVRAGAPTLCDSGAFEGILRQLFLPLIIR